ncbi:MAG: DUF5677 domain-containing protein [candidate division Zixibacteria bacterium]|nr:DUF5677 domain-containing protein [candidate division Zixibacteria bacterium]
MLDDASFVKVLGSALNVSKQTTEQSCTRGQREGSLFLLKNCLSGLTLFRIFNPTDFSEFPQVGPSFKVNDFPTAYVIIRTMFETYINMYYVLIEPKREAEKEHRLDLWECHGYAQTLIMGKTFGLQDDALKVTEGNYRQIKKKIISSDFYKSLSKKKKESIKADEWNPNVNKVALAIRSGFHPTQARFFYKFLSNYAHSERYSLMQMGEVKSPQHSEGLLNSFPKTFAEMLLALTVNAFAKMYSPAMDLIAKDEELLKILNGWEKAKRKDFTKWDDELVKY